MYKARRSAALIFASAVAVGAAIATAVSASAAAHVARASRATVPLAGWGTAQEVSTAGLNKGSGALIESVSCAAAGNCGAGGVYNVAPFSDQAFVVSEVNGSWRKAAELPGIATLDQGGGLYNIVVSCPSAGNCGAGGSYTVGTGDSAHQQVFVASQTNGTWHNAEAVPGSATLNKGGSAYLHSLSCPSPGNCAAGGQYTDGSGHIQPFVVSEVSGAWQNAEKVPGIAALNLGGVAIVNSLSCASVGNCVAGGQYLHGTSDDQAFVVSEVSGTWQQAKEVPGIAVLNAGGHANIWSVSCASAGNCSAGGDYYDGAQNEQAFVASEVNGTWLKAKEVPGMLALGSGEIDSVSCVTAGNCSAGGSYFLGNTNNEEVLVVSEVNGIWQQARELPGIGGLNLGGPAPYKYAVIGDVSCAAAGSCAVGGVYTDGSGHQQAFVASEVSGTWQKAQEAPGTATLNQSGAAEIESVSCVAAGNCTAGGYYRDGSDHLQAFVVSKA